MNTSESVSDFVRRAFPAGTVPLEMPASPDREISFPHYAFNLVTWEEGTNPFECEGKNAIDRVEPFPVWPPDLFAACATLIEQSATYLRMAYVGAPPDDKDPWPVDARELVELVSDSDVLAFSHKALTVCRMVGALWRSGALFISGDGGAKCAGEIDSSLVIRELRLSCRDAIEDLGNSFRIELNRNDLRALPEAIRHAHLAKRFEPSPDDPDDRVLASKNHNLAWSRLYEILNEELETSAKPEHFKRNSERLDRKYSKPYEVFLVHWALEFIADLWLIVRSATTDYVLKADEANGKLSPWQVAAALLLIIADEASRGIGFSSKQVDPDREKDTDESDTSEASGGSENEGGQDTRDEAEWRAALERNDVLGLSCRDLWQQHIILLAEWAMRYPRTVARCFDGGLGAVMPKARTPALGCTLRSLSHHLALLPPKGRIRPRWVQQMKIADLDTFNLLLIPYPFEIRSDDVEPCEHDEGPTNRGWGRFSIEPNWLKRPRGPVPPGLNKKQKEAWKSGFDNDTEGQARSAEHVWLFVKELIDDQPKNVINGIVFPEASLTSRVFRRICDGLSSDPKYASITLLVSGLTEVETEQVDQTGAKTEVLTQGNFVATFMRLRGADQWHIRSVRSKHHRWSLEKSQLSSYALSNRLAPDRMWWENIPLLPREMVFAEFSQGSILTSLICEDLARIDPCQIALRSVGPNLTLVLLMDSAQITTRWPAQYAGVLADDPGTSVLTLTSMGLLRRANLSEGYGSRAIALWREPSGGAARSIDLPKGHHAQLLSLRRDRLREVTIDGRGDGNRSVAWRLAGTVPIRVSENLPPGFPEFDL